MKTIVAFLCLVVAASLARAQSAPASPAAKPTESKTAAVKPADPKATSVAAKPTDPKAAPTAPVDPKAAKKEVKKEAPLPKIPGTVISRPNGTFLGLQLVSGNFVLSFYDKKHKPMAVDVTRATARWPNNKTSLPKDYRTVLNGSGTALVGSRPVLPPFNFSVSINLLKGEGDKAVLPPYVFSVVFNLLQGEGDEAKVVETYTVPFSG